MIDHRLLESLCAGKAESRRTIVAQFRCHAQVDLAAVQQAAAAGDFERVTHFSHRIRGSSAMLGAVRLAESCRDLEAFSRAHDRHGVFESVAVLVHEMRLLEDYLERAQTRADEDAVGDRLRFLVVEDHEFQRNVLVRTLAGLGAGEVLQAADGAAALDLFRAADPPVDIILSDLDMPGMDGLELMRRVGALRKGVSVILATALEAPAPGAVEATARDCGVKLLGLVSKPLTARKLRSLLELHAAGTGRPAG
jgi:CheY-like chemotaxis protein